MKAWGTLVILFGDSRPYDVKPISGRLQMLQMRLTLPDSAIRWLVWVMHRWIDLRGGVGHVDMGWEELNHIIYHITAVVINIYFVAVIIFWGLANIPKIKAMGVPCELVRWFVMKNQSGSWGGSVPFYLNKTSHWFGLLTIIYGWYKIGGEDLDWW